MHMFSPSSLSRTIHSEWKPPSHPFVIFLPHFPPSFLLPRNHHNLDWLFTTAVQVFNTFTITKMLYPPPTCRIVLYAFKLDINDIVCLSAICFWCLIYFLRDAGTCISSAFIFNCCVLFYVFFFSWWRFFFQPCLLLPCFTLFVLRLNSSPHVPPGEMLHRQKRTGKGTLGLLRARENSPCSDLHDGDTVF